MSLTANPAPAQQGAQQENPLKALNRFGQSIWLDYIRRDLMTTGKLAQMIREDGLRGMTSNPTIFEKAISGSPDYKQFLDEYNNYWRTFFDPIAVRIQVTPERYRLETIVLPLINNSIYKGMATALGGKPEPLDALPVPKRNIFSIQARFDKEALMKEDEFKDLVAGEKDDAREVREGMECGIRLENFNDVKEGDLLEAFKIEEVKRTLE